MDPTTTTTPTATSTPPTGFLPFANGSSGKPPLFHSLAQSAQLQVSYKECLRNHAAAIGGHAVDGCCEYMPSSSSSGPTSLKCAACGCHRNFHRRDPDDPLPIQQHHAPSAPLLPPPPPPPPSSSLYSSALLALGSRDNSDRASGKKRGKRTRFSIEQKERMREFAERIGWRIRRADGDEIDEFCEEVGVGKGALKVWMHNHKHGYKLRRSSSNGIVDDNDENDEGNRDDEGGDHEVGVNCRDR